MRHLRPSRKVLPEDGRAHNRAMLLQQLFHAGPASRAQLARATALTRVTVADLISTLIAEGLVDELGPHPEGRIGKPATMLRLRTDAFNIVAIDLTDEASIHGAVLDMAGEFQSRTTAPVAGLRGTEAIDALRETAAALVASADRPLLGVGIASPGVIDAQGTVLQAPNRGWFDVPLAAQLQAELGVPVHVANDANAAVLGEFTYGAASSDGVMVVTVGQGVGAGIVLQGQLVQGKRHAAGELGHVRVVEEEEHPDGSLEWVPEPCACGRRGCLETILSVPSLRRRLDGLSSAQSQTVLGAVGRRLGMCLSPVVSALNLSEVILAGPVALLDGELVAQTLATVKERTMPVIGDDVEIRMSTLGEDGALLGAAVLVLSGQLGFS